MSKYAVVQGYNGSISFHNTALFNTRAEATHYMAWYRYSIKSKNEAHKKFWGKNEFDVSVVLVHHLRKPFVTYRGDSVDQGAMDFRGSTVIPAWADTMIRLEEIKSKNRVGG